MSKIIINDLGEDRLEILKIYINVTHKSYDEAVKDIGGGLPIEIDCISEGEIQQAIQRFRAAGCDVNGLEGKSGPTKIVISNLGKNMVDILELYMDATKKNYEDSVLNFKEPLPYVLYFDNRIEAENYMNRFQEAGCAVDIFWDEKKKKPPEAKKEELENNKQAPEEGSIPVSTDSSFWNSREFTKAAITFGYISDFLYGIFSIAVTVLAFSYASGFLRILMICGSIGGVYKIISNAQKRKAFKKTYSICPKCGVKMPRMNYCPVCGESVPKPNGGTSWAEDVKTIERNKKGLVIFTVVIVILIIILVFALPHQSILSSELAMERAVRGGSFPQFDSITLEHLFQREMSKPKWETEKISDTSAIVTVSGYIPYYDENVGVDFYVDSFQDKITFSIYKVRLIDSGYTYSDNLSIATFMSTLYS